MLRRAKSRPEVEAGHGFGLAGRLLLAAGLTLRAALGLVETGGQAAPV